MPKRLCEARHEGRGQRDLGQQDQRLPPGPDRVGHRLEEHLGLARPGDAVEQRHAEAVDPDPANLLERRGLSLAQGRRLGVGIGRQRYGRRRHLDPLDRP